MKKCTKCQIEKPLSEFHVRSRNKKDGHSYYCVICTNLRYLEYYNRMKEEKGPLFYEQKMDAQYKYLYGISLEERNQLEKAQDYKCAICRQKKELQIDHDHSCCPGMKTCGKCIRGMLCFTCNTALGKFGDDPVIIKRVLSYLEYNLSTSTHQLEFPL